jgi:ribonuclease Z
MKVTFLGTGAAFPDPDRGQSAILLTLSNGRHFLFDCGMGATRQMVRANVNPADVPVICFSHLHYDHLCDFPAFIINGWMFNRAEAPIVIGPKGLKTFVSHLFEGGAFQADIQARSLYPSRQKNIVAIRPDVREISPGPVYADDDIRIMCDHVDHIPRHVSECFGFRIEAEGKVIAYSGDTGL